MSKGNFIAVGYAVLLSASGAVLLLLVAAGVEGARVGLRRVVHH